jgi:hypothetical protein
MKCKSESFERRRNILPRYIPNHHPVSIMVFIGENMRGLLVRNPLMVLHSVSI